MESFTFGARGIFIPKKLYLLLLGLPIIFISLYDIKHMLKSIYAYLMSCIIILYISAFKRNREIVWSLVFLAKNILNIANVAKRRRSLKGNVIFSYNEVIRVLKQRNYYLNFAAHITKIFKSYVLKR